MNVSECGKIFLLQFIHSEPSTCTMLLCYSAQFTCRYSLIMGTLSIGWPRRFSPRSLPMMFFFSVGSVLGQLHPDAFFIAYSFPGFVCVCVCVWAHARGMYEIDKCGGKNTVDLSRHDCGGFAIKTHKPLLHSSCEFH